MKKLVLCAGIISLAFPALAEIAGPVDDGTNMRHKVQFYIHDADTNGDGLISRAEAQAYTDKMFNEADVNKDGSLSQDEIMDFKMKQKDRFKIWEGKNDSDIKNNINQKNN